MAVFGVLLHSMLLADPARAQNPATSDTVNRVTGKQSTAYRFRLLGVYDETTGTPLGGVEVADILNGNKAETSVTGTVSLLFLPDGGGLVRLRKVGYAMQTLTIAISPTDTTPLTVLLQRATELPAVTVKDSAGTHLSTHMRAFEEHRREGLGQYITEAEMRKADDRSFAGLITGKLTGLQQVHPPPPKTSSIYLVSTRVGCTGPALLAKCGGVSCAVRVITNGVVTWDSSMGAATAPDFSRYDVRDYQAVEFYPSGAILPSGISPSNGECGTLILYTRDR